LAHREGARLVTWDAQQLQRVPFAVEAQMPVKALAGF
jgi:hypothetical protein